MVAAGVANYVPLKTLFRRAVYRVGAIVVETGALAERYLSPACLDRTVVRTGRMDP